MASKAASTSRSVNCRSGTTGVSSSEEHDRQRIVTPNKNNVVLNNLMLPLLLDAPANVLALIVSDSVAVRAGCRQLQRLI